MGKDADQDGEIACLAYPPLKKNTRPREALYLLRCYVEMAGVEPDPATSKTLKNAKIGLFREKRFCSFCYFDLSRYNYDTVKIVLGNKQALPQFWRHSISSSS